LILSRAGKLLNLRRNQPMEAFRRDTKKLHLRTYAQLLRPVATPFINCTAQQAGDDHRLFETSAFEDSGLARGVGNGELIDAVDRVNRNPIGLPQVVKSNFFHLHTHPFLPRIASSFFLFALNAQSVGENYHGKKKSFRGAYCLESRNQVSSVFIIREAVVCGVFSASPASDSGRRMI
jgi:hypothetical protein